MGFFDRLLKREASAGRYLTETDALTGVQIGEPHFIGDPFNLLRRDNWDALLSFPAAHNATMLISHLFADLPRQAFTEYGGKEKTKLPESSLLEKPCPWETGYESYRAWCIDYIYNGNAIGIIADRDSRGIPTVILPVRTQDTQIARNTRTGDIEYVVTNATTGISRLYDPEDIFHVKGPCRPGDIRGKGILEYAAETINEGSRRRRATRKIFEHGVPTVILSVKGGTVEGPDGKPVKFSSAAAKAMAESFLRAREANSVAVTNEQVEITPVSWNPTDLQLDKLKALENDDWAQFFGLPGYFLNVPNSSRTYSNVTEEALNLTRFTLTRYTTPFEEVLSNLHPTKTYVKFNYSATLLKADTGSRYEAYSVAVSSGFMTVNEVRDLEDLPPLENGES